MRVRELVFGAVALVLLVGYLFAGSLAFNTLGSTALPTPRPSAPREEVPSLLLPGTLAFVIEGDVYVMRDGSYRPQTSEGRNHQPALGAGGDTVVFYRSERIDGQAIAGGQRVNSQMGYSSVVSKNAQGGPETTLLNGLRREVPTGFHEVSWFVSPSLSPDGRRLAYLEDDGGGFADLVVLDIASGRRTVISGGANLGDTAWSPDGARILTTSYNTEVAGILVWDSSRAGFASRIGSLPEGDAYRPSYSADGLWITYTLRTADGRNDLHAFEIATGRDVQLSFDGRSWNGVFSPDGLWIAFLREQNGTIDVFVMELNGALADGTPKEAVKITSGQGIDGTSRPSWSR